jgi:cell division transport system permease protein
MRILKESFINLRRNRFLTLASIISIGLILSIFNILLTVNHITRDQIDSLADKINLNIYIENTVSEEQISEIEQFLSRLPEVEEVNTISHEQALAQIQNKYPESSNFIQDFNIENPLPYTLQVKTRQLEDKDQVVNILQQSDYKEFIFRSESKNEYNQTINTVVNNLIAIRDFSFQVILWVMITFIVAGSLIMFNAIRTTLFTRRSEIQIMQFVGATFKRIMVPFIIEGILIGMFGFLLSLGLVLILNGFLPFSSFTIFRDIQALVVQLVIASSIGMLTSAYVVNKYLNTREIFHDN